MNPAHAQTLRDLLQAQRIASLGTLHQGEPYVSMVPFAILPGGSGFVNFSDFSLFAILPQSIRFVGGFAQATTITPEVLAEVLSKAY